MLSPSTARYLTSSRLTESRKSLKGRRTVMYFAGGMYPGTGDFLDGQTATRSCAAAYARKNLVVMPIREEIDLDDGFFPLLLLLLLPALGPELLLPLPELLRASSSGLPASF